MVSGFGDSPILRLTIETQKAVRSRDAGEILQQIPISFEQHRRSIRETASTELRIVSVRVGSLTADFMAYAAGVVTLYEFREILVSYVQRLCDVFDVMRGLSKGAVTASERKTIEALAKPVANDNATQVCLQVHGDNSTILIINVEGTALLAERAPKPIRRLVEDVRVLPTQPVLLVEQLEPRGGKIEGFKRENLRRQDKLVLPRKSSEISGKLIWVDGKWYVRLDGLQTLLPLEPAKRAKGLPKGRSYSVAGQIITELGIPSGFNVITISDNL